MQFPRARVVLFAREPRPGGVKTRLIPALGEVGAMDLHEQLLRRQLEVLRATSLCPAELWVDGDPAHPAFASFEGERRRQEGEGLGERLEKAARRVLEKNACVVIIGCDCPALDAAYLASAVRVLDEGVGAVLGPAADGGFVLIGLRKVTPGVFEGIDWGTDAVLRQTLRNLRREGLETRLLDERADIDRPEDLESLAGFGIHPRITRRALAGDESGKN